jgi:hypothetical protein
MKEQRKQRGWICDNCDTINVELMVCSSCGLQTNYFRRRLKLYKLHNVWGTMKEQMERFHISQTAVRKHADEIQ